MNKNPPDSRPIRICICDDDPTVRSVLNAWLKAQPHYEIVGLVVDGKSCLELCRKNRPEVLILDIDMPDMSGLEVAEILLKEMPDLLVIHLSGWRDDRASQRSIRAGVKDYINKPVMGSVLDSRIQDIYRSARSQVPTPGPRGDPDSPPGDPSGFILFTGPVDRVGTTTIAVNLAVRISRLLKRPPLLVDMDSRFGLATHQLGIDPKVSWSDVLRARVDDPSRLLKGYVEETSFGTDLLPNQPSGERLLERDDLAAILGLLDHTRGCVILDCPPPTRLERKSLLARVGQVWLVTTNDACTSRQTLTELASLKHAGVDSKKIHIVLNKILEDQEGLAMMEVQALIKHPIAVTFERAFQELEDAFLTRTPVALRDNHRNANALDELANQVIRVGDLLKGSSMDSIPARMTESTGGRYGLKGLS